MLIGSLKHCSTLDPVLRKEEAGFNWRLPVLLAMVGLYLNLTPGEQLVLHNSHISLILKVTIRSSRLYGYRGLRQQAVHAQAACMCQVPGAAALHTCA